MSKIKHKLTNTLIHLPIDSSPHPLLALLLTLLAVMQLIAAITHPKSQLHKVTSWTDPNVYISSAFAVVSGTVLTVAYVVLLAVKLIATEKDEKLVQPTMCLRYLGTLLAYLKLICETVVIGPLLIGCLTEFDKATTNNGVLGMAVIGFILYFGVVYPITLYCSSDTSILTQNGDRKVQILNVELIFHIYKIIMVTCGVLSQTSMLAIAPIFFLIYTLVVIKRPYFCFQGQMFKRVVLSMVAFVALARGLNAIFQRPQGLVLIELAGMAGFACLIEWVALFRLRKILEGKEISTYKVKLLIQMANNLEIYLQNLQNFIFMHYRQCSSEICKCRQVVTYLGQKQSPLSSDTIWYQFIVSYIQSEYNLRLMSALPKSQLQARTQEYQQIVFDLAEINLFKLGRKNQAYLLVSHFKNHIEGNELEHMMNKRRNKVFLYYLHGAVSEGWKDHQAINHSADRYLQFQVEFTKYLKLLLKSSTRAIKFWEELGKRDPHQPTLLQDIEVLEQWNIKIQKIYLRITQAYPQSTDILDPITNSYFKSVLNIVEKDEFHVIKSQPFEGKERRKDKEKRMDQNTRIFSFDSETPVCFVSAQPSSLGRIQFTNTFFDRFMENECGKVFKLNDLIIPELRKDHDRKMEEFVGKDGPSCQHKDTFIRTGGNKIMMTDVLIQLVPSMSEGLRYGVFFKGIHSQKRVICVSHGGISYMSQSFETFIEVRMDEDQLKERITEELIDEIKVNKKILWELEGQNYTIQYIRHFGTEDGELVLLLLNGGQEEAQDLRTFSLCNKIVSKNNRVEKEQNLTSQTPLQEVTNGSGLLKSSNLGPKMISNKKKATFDDKRKSMEDVEWAETTVEREKKVQQRVKKMFMGLFGSPQKERLPVKLGCFCIAFFVVVVTAILISLIAVKNLNQKHYYAVSNNYQKYHNLITLIAETATHLEQLNFHSVVASINATDSFAKLTATGSVNTAMDDFVSFFNIQDIGQDWQTLNLLANGTFDPLVESYFMAVFDFLQGPISNLARNYNITDFNFPLAYQLLSPPLTPIQTQLHTFVTNALYFALPNFRTLKMGTMAPIVESTMKRSLPSIVLNVMIMGVVVLGMITMLINSWRVMRARNTAFRFMEELTPEFIRNKKHSCEVFSSLYSIAVAEDQVKTEKTVPLAQSKDSQTHFGNRRTPSKMVSQNTERELNFNDSMLPEKTEDVNSKKVELQKRRKTKIFTEVYSCRLCLKMVLFTFPLFIFAIFFAVAAKKEETKLWKIINLQDELSYMVRDATIIKLYSLHQGVYTPSLETYKSMPAALNGHIHEMFSLLQYIMSDWKGSFAPEAQKFIRRLQGDICQLEQEGYFSHSSYQFPGRGSLSFCQSISNNILSQGYLPSYLHFLESANRNYQNHLGTPNYTLPQRQAYLGNYFLTNTSQMVHYYTLLGQESLYYTKIDLANTINWETRVLTIAAAIFIVYAFCFIFLRNCFLCHIRERIVEVRALFLLVSCRSVIANQKMKNEFVGKEDIWKAVK